MATGLSAAPTPRAAWAPHQELRSPRRPAFPWHPTPGLHRRARGRGFFVGGGAQQQCSASASCPQTQVAASPAAHPGGQLEQPWDPFTFPGPTKVFEVQAGTSSSRPAGATVGRWLWGASQFLCLLTGLHCRCWLAQARGRVLVILSSAGPWVSTSTREPESRLSGCVGGGLQRAGACVGSCLKHAPHSSPRSWEGGAHRLAAARGPADRGRWCSPPSGGLSTRQ